MCFAPSKIFYNLYYKCILVGLHPAGSREVDCCVNLEFNMICDHFSSMTTHQELQRKEASRLHFLSSQTASVVLLLLLDVQRRPQLLNQVQLNLGMTQICNKTHSALYLHVSLMLRVVQVRVQAGDSVLCSWARHFTCTDPLYTQVFKWLPANLMLGVTLW